MTTVTQMVLEVKRIIKIIVPSGLEKSDSLGI